MEIFRPMDQFGSDSDLYLEALHNAYVSRQSISISCSLCTVQWPSLLSPAILYSKTDRPSHTVYAYISLSHLLCLKALLV